MDSLAMDLAYGPGSGGQVADRVARLGRATLLLSRELAASRREIAELRRENAKLRARLASHPSGGGR
jgi:hypothetical protein